jgi:heme-degrading monooxygenase HmoA
MNESQERKETNMYGTVARYRIKPGMENQLRQILEEQARVFEAGQVRGFVASYAYRIDADPNDYYLAVVFESREAYWALAQSPKQDARYRQLLAVLESAPEWHDGEIVYALQVQATM